MHSTILYIGEDRSIESSLRSLLDRIRGCRLESIANHDRARQRLREDDVDMLLVHFAGSGSESEVVEYLSLAAKRPNALPAIVLSDCSDPSVRLRFLEASALDCLVRPVDLSRLALLIDLTTAAQRFRPAPSPAAKRQPAQSPGTIIDDFLCATPEMRNLLEQAQRVATLATTVLLTGETGTGKTSLARLIHRWSQRREKPLVTVQCGAISATLLDSALFGHVRGAFTGADRDQAGRFAEAKDGTILLDEVDCMPLESQAKLLAAVEERVFEPLGTVRPQPLKARLIFATNRCLEDEVAAGRFRADLYYRLNVVGFALPGLREQPAAIAPLAERFLTTYQAQTGRDVRSFTPQALAALKHYDWPGNVRELRNVVERAVALCAGREIDLHDLTGAIQQRSKLEFDERPRPSDRDGNQLAQARASAEVTRLRAALQRNNNNRTHAAAELGVSRMTLFKKLRRYGLS